MAVTGEMIDIACRLRPADCCLVPEKRQELTTEGGLDVAGNLGAITAASQQLMDAGIRVSLFIDPDPEQIDAARTTGAAAVELHTGNYADTGDAESAEAELERVRSAAAYAQAQGFVVNAGHGLNYENVSAIAAIEPIVELNIGHAIIAQAVFSGLGEAVSEMKRLMLAARK